MMIEISKPVNWVLHNYGVWIPFATRPRRTKTCQHSLIKPWGGKDWVTNIWIIDIFYIDF